MSKLTAYTLEVYKADRRIKGGYRLVEKPDFEPVTRDYIETVAESKMSQGFIVKIFVFKIQEVDGETSLDSGLCFIELGRPCPAQQNLLRFRARGLRR